MADAQIPLPGDAGLFITKTGLLRAVSSAFDIAQRLSEARHAEPSMQEDSLLRAQRSVVELGHTLGFVFTEPKKFSGAVAAQRMDMALEYGARRHQADMMAKASGADVWRHRAEVAEEAVRNLTEQLERVCGESPGLQLVAAE